VPFTLEFVLRKPVWRVVMIAADLGWTFQTVEISGTQKAVSFTGEYQLDTWNLGVGPGVLVRASESVVLMAAIEAMVTLTTWSAPSVGSCGTNCVLIGDSPPDSQTEFGFAGAARAGALFPFEDDAVALGVDVRYLLAARHSASNMPIGAISLMLALTLKL
jgi:hypothetical protein